MTNILHRIRSFGIMRTMIYATFIIFFVSGFLDDLIRYPNIWEKLRQVQETFQQECTPEQLPGSVLHNSKYYDKKSAPSAHFDYTYSVDKSWPEVQRYYMEKANTYGWKFRNDGQHIYLTKGERGDEYSLHIHPGQEANTLVVILYWFGSRPILNTVDLSPLIWIIPITTVIIIVYLLTKKEKTT